MEEPQENENESKGGTPQNNNNDEIHIEENKENIINNTLPFKYLEKDNSPESIIFDPGENVSILESDKGNYNYSICILLKDDSQKSSELLKNTLNSIYGNRDTLATIGIGTSNLLICVFINEIRGFSLFNKDEFYKMRKENNSINTCLYLKTHKEGYNSSSSVYIFAKPSYFESVEALKYYYTGIIKTIKLDNKILFSSVMTAGIRAHPIALKKLIVNSYLGENRGVKGATVGLVLSEGEGLFSMVEQYERLHFNVYDMHFYGATSSFPVSSLLSTMAIDHSMFEVLKTFYIGIDTNCTIDYHDYNLGIFLNENNKDVTFPSDEVAGTMNYIDLNYLDYQTIWINRYSGYYGNIFKILKCFSINFNLMKAIFLFFHIVGMLIEFIYPALSTMVIYAIFFEAFDSFDYRPASFFTMMYVCMLTASGMCSLVSKNPKELRRANIFLYIFMEVFYIFTLICAIVAMDNINKNKNNDEYKFNKAAISCIIIFTFIPYIIPILMKLSLFTSKITNMLVYIGLGASCSTSNFLMAQLWNASDTVGGKQKEERKSVVLIFFFLYNLFFGFLGVYNYNRERKAKCVMGLGIMFLIYNFFRCMAIIARILGRKNGIDPNIHLKIISRIRDELEKGEFNDIRSEEKSLKKSSQLYNSNNNYGDNEQY
jgi:hypothetical protein